MVAFWFRPSGKGIANNNYKISCSTSGRVSTRMGDRSLVYRLGI